MRFSISAYLPALLFSLLLLATVGFLLEIKTMMGYLDTDVFWRQTLMAALPTGGVLAALVVYAQRNQLADAVDKMRTFLLVFFMVLLGLPTLASGYNRWQPDAPAREVDVAFDAELARYGSRFGAAPGTRAVPNQYLLFFRWNNRLYKAAYATPRYPDAQPGDTIRLRIQRGRLGWHWLY